MIKLIVGLGNPGAEYAKTRHNAGAWLVKAFAAQYQVSLKRQKDIYGERGQVVLDNYRCSLCLPMTYMNLSGQAVVAFAHHYRLKPEQILVVHDELNLPVGAVKLKFSGGHGGHNGLRDIFAKLASQEFYRLRIGLGKPVNKHSDLADYVLHAPTKTEYIAIEAAMTRAMMVLPLLITGQINKAMKELNTDDIQAT